MADGSTRDAILAAAGDVLAAEGIEGFTTAAVADAADVSQGLVHHYFATKHDLLRRLFERGWENARRDIRQATDADDPRERLLAFAGYLLAPEEQRAKRLSVARIDLELRAQAMHDERLRDVFDRWRAGVLDVAVQIVEDGVERGQFRPIDVDRFAAVFVSAVVDAEQLFAIYGGPDASEPILDGLSRVVDGYLVADGRDARPDAPG